jgi:hypothetical protein
MPAPAIAVPAAMKNTTVAARPIEEKTYWCSRWSAGNLFLDEGLGNAPPEQIGGFTP